MKVTLYGNRVFADVELRILSWGDYPGLSTWALNAFASVLKRGGQRFDHTEKKEI